jgi:hypothetical protein
MMDECQGVMPGSNRKSWLRVLLIVNGTIWIVFCVLGLLSPHAQFGLPTGSRWVILALMAINGLALISFGLIINRGSRLVIFLAAGYVALNMLLSITDEVGFFDIFVLGLNLLILALLFPDFKTNPHKLC